MYSHPPSLGYQIAICRELFGKLSLEDPLYSLVSYSTAFQSFPKQYGGNKCSQTGCDYSDRLWYYIQWFWLRFHQRLQRSHLYLSKVGTRPRNDVQ